MIIITGGTRKRGATWSYYFDLGTIGGKRQKKEKGGFKTKKEAETALAKAINEYNNAGQLFEPSEITVSDYLDQWYDLYCKPNLKYNTQIGYLRIMEGHLKPRFGRYRLKAVTAAALQEYANKLKTDGLAKHSITGILSVFGAALDYAVEPLHYIPANPMRYVKYPSTFSFSIWAGVCEEDSESLQQEAVEVPVYTSPLEEDSVENIREYGTAENIRSLKNNLSKLILCVEMENWEKAEMFMDTVRELTGGAPREVGRIVLRLKMAIQKENYDRIATEFAELNRLLETQGG